MPRVPLKNIAAIGGAVMISIDSTTPIPPCCSAMLLMLSGPAPSSALAQNDAATAITMSVASVTMTLSNASENIVPNP